MGCHFDIISYNRKTQERFARFIFQDKKDQVEVRDSKFRPSRPSDLLFRLYPGAIRGAGLLYLWYTAFRTDVVRQEYH